MAQTLTKEELQKLIDDRAKIFVQTAFETLVERLAKTPAAGGLTSIYGAGDPVAQGGDKVFNKGFSEDQVRKGASGFLGMREFLRCVALSPGDSRLIPAAKALTEGDPESAGFLVPVEYFGRLLSMAIERGRIFPLCQSVPMKSSEMKAPVAASIDESSGLLFGNIRYEWIDEGGSKPEMEFKLLELGLKARVCCATAKSSNQILEDSSPRAEAVINEIFGASFSWTLDNVVLNGTGAGQPRGIIEAPGTYVVAKEAGQAAATILWPNIKKMFGRLWPDSQESTSLRWLINSECVEQILSLNQPIGTAGSSVIIASGEGIRPIPRTILGVPVIWTSHASALGAKGDIILADLGQYILGLRKALTVAVSAHLYFLTNFTAYRFEARLDGQPIIPAKIKSRTGYESSPFVVLAART